jgi:hypothetical protein
MTVQQADIFHCLSCGEVVYKPHGSRAPEHCGRPMVRAVAGIEKDIPDRKTNGGATRHQPGHSTSAT